MMAEIEHLGGEPGTGRDVLLLHGFMGSTNDWKKFSWPKDRTWYALDLPGHGRSAGVRTGKLTYGFVPDFIRQQLDRAGIGSIDLVGYSMGARFALAFGKTFPERVRSLVLESASPGIKNEEDREKRLKLDRQRAGAIQDSFGDFLHRWYRSSLFKSLEYRPELQRQLTEDRLSNDPDRMAEVICAFSPAAQPDYSAWLRQTPIPVTAITGALDERYTSLWADLAAGGPANRLNHRSGPNRKNGRILHVIVPGAGHNVHAERPRLYLDALMRSFPDQT